MGDAHCEISAAPFAFSYDNVNPDSYRQPNTIAM